MFPKERYTGKKMIQLIDHNPQMCAHWYSQFHNCKDVSIHCGDFFSLPTNCIVSPANSFGFMDGALDLAISNKLGWHLQEKLQTQIRQKYLGEILVGQAELIETGDSEIPFCISAPTMRVPAMLNETVNIYLAAKAIFHLVKNESRIRTVSISGLGTGVGRVDPSISALQMKKAYDDIWLGKLTQPSSWIDAQKEHQLLYRQEYKDLQFET